MKNEFLQMPILDNFYQSSSFFPMPLTLIGTIDDNGNTSFGAYSLVFPYYIAGKDSYAMILEVRNSSNTCKHLLKRGKCTINFLPYTKKIMKEVVRLGFPGDTPEEKMKDFKFHMEDSLSQKNDPNNNYPKIISEAIQVFECTWWSELDNAENDRVQEEYLGPYHNFNGITSKYGAHFILKIDHILLKEKYQKALKTGVTKANFAPIPTNWGYRDSKNFWCSGYKKGDYVEIADKEVDITSVKYAAERADDIVKFSDDALKMLVKIPRPFLKMAIAGMVKWAKEHDCTLITEIEMKLINEERKKKK